MLIHLFMPHLATMHGGPTFWPLNVLVAAISQPGDQRLARLRGILHLDRKV